MILLWLFIAFACGYGLAAVLFNIKVKDLEAELKYYKENPHFKGLGVGDVPTEEIRTFHAEGIEINGEGHIVLKGQKKEKK